MGLKENDKIVLVAINELKPHPKNTNKHPKEQIERLAKIINYQGFRSPIVVSNLSGFIVAGHGRLEAAKKLGLTKVPVSYQDFEDAKMELAHLNADNAIALWAEIDMKAMTESLNEIGFDLDLDFLGFKDFSLGNDVKESDLPDLPTGEAELCQMTFTLSLEQKDLIENKISEFLSNNKYVTDPEYPSINTNKNGNALFEIVNLYEAN